jgi:O-antigen ligase
MSNAARQAGVFESARSAPLLPLAWSGAAVAAAQRSTASIGHYAYALFILVNASLFVRPAELVPAVEGWPIYAVLATFALAAALAVVLPQLALASLIERPITACVLGMLVAVVLSHLTIPFVWAARVSGTEFLKVVLYYLLLVGVVDSAARMRHFLGWLVKLGVIVTGLALLQYHGWIDIPALAEVEHGFTDAETGERSVVVRMVSTGIFNDPNDLCLLLVLTMAACVHGFEYSDSSRRYFWLAPLALFGYALTLTHSRGGFLGMLAAVVVFIWVRLGWRRGLPIASIALPVMFFVFAGRQTELAVGEGTAQERIQLWSNGLTLFRQAPVFGIGYGRFVEEVEKVAHNSFVHTFAELGFFGGTIFLGAFAIAFRSVQRLGASDTAAAMIDPDLLRLRPYLLAIMAGYVVGMMSLSRAYVVPTYVILGLAAAYVEIGRASSGVPLPRVGFGLAARVGALSVAFLACTYVFVRLFVQWG